MKNLKITLEIGEYDYSEVMANENGDGQIWITNIKEILELTPYEIEKHRGVEEINKMFLLTLKKLNEEYKRYVLLRDTNNLPK